MRALASFRLGPVARDVPDGDTSLLGEPNKIIGDDNVHANYVGPFDGYDASGGVKEDRVERGRQAQTSRSSSRATCL